MLCDNNLVWIGFLRRASLQGGETSVGNHIAPTMTCVRVLVRFKCCPVCGDVAVFFTDRNFFLTPIDGLSVMSHTLPHAASGSYEGLVTTPSPPTTRHPVAQAPTTDQGDHK